MAVYGVDVEVIPLARGDGSRTRVCVSAVPAIWRDAGHAPRRS